MALDLRRTQTFVGELIMVDRCTIWRDPEGTSDDNLDSVTLSYGATADAVAVESDLACSVRWQLRGGYTGESGQPITISEYLWKTGMPFENVLDGDWIEITESVHDERLVGKHIKVIEVIHGSLAVVRRARCQLRELGVEQP